MSAPLSTSPKSCIESSENREFSLAVSSLTTMLDDLFLNKDVKSI